MRWALFLLVLSGCGACGPVPACEPCEDDGDCAAGLFAEETGVCLRGFCCAEDDAATCELSQFESRCPALFDGEHGNGELETAGLCDPCETDADCVDGSCSDGLCMICGEPPCNVAPCVSRGACLLCDSDAQCARRDLVSGASLCVRGRCCPESEPGAGCGFTELKVLCGDGFEDLVDQRSVCEACTGDDTCGDDGACVAGVCCVRAPGRCDAAEAQAYCATE